MAVCLASVCKYFTFVHAFGGCNTTSAVYDQRELSILNLLEKNKAADIFLQPNSDVEAVGNAGTKLFVMLYGGKNADTSLSSAVLEVYKKWLCLHLP